MRPRALGPGSHWRRGRRGPISFPSESLKLVASTACVTCCGSVHAQAHLLHSHITVS
jgi:hypothetical protein